MREARKSAMTLSRSSTRMSPAISSHGMLASHSLRLTSWTFFREWQKMIDVDTASVMYRSSSTSSLDRPPTDTSHHTWVMS